MPFIALLIAVIIIVVAFNNQAGALATQLEGDIPGYFKWAAAIAAIVGVGFIPGLKTPSRWLLGLVLVVLLMKNYSTIFSGFQSFLTSTPTATSSTTPNPAAAYVTSGGTSGTPTAAEIAGSGATSSTATASAAATGVSQTLTAAQQLAANPLNPNAYVGLAAGFGGLA
jgi:hypothetical protein